VADNDPAAALELDEIAFLAGGEIAGRGAPEKLLADREACARAGVLYLPFLEYVERWGAEFRLKLGVAVSPARRSPEDAAAGGAPPAVAAQCLTYTYPSGVAALAGLELTVAEGEFLAVVGENGGGKTTLAKAVAGLLRPSGGSVTLRGRPPADFPARERARAVGYLFQNPDHQIFQAAVRDEVAFGPRQLRESEAEVERRVDAAVAAVGLEGREDEDPFAMPKGDRQRVALASVLAMEPRVLVMDEPTTGLDRREVATLMEAVVALNRRGATVIFITHAMDVVAEYARRVAVVAGGRLLAEGSPRTILRDEELLSRAGLEAPLAARLGRAFGLDAITAEELARSLGAGEGGGAA
jgi:energy-coupling factor transporter ATP-binding protein EcfA2